MSERQDTARDRHPETPSWDDLGMIQRSLLEETLRRGEDVGARFAPAVVEYLERRRRHGLWLAGTGLALSLLVVAPVAAFLTWWIDRDSGAAPLIGALTGLVLALVLAGAGLYQAGSAARRLQRVGGQRSNVRRAPPTGLGR